MRKLNIQIEGRDRGRLAEAQRGTHPPSGNLSFLGPVIPVVPVCLDSTKQALSVFICDDSSETRSFPEQLF